MGWTWEYSGSAKEFSHQCARKFLADRVQARPDLLGFDRATGLLEQERVPGQERTQVFDRFRPERRVPRGALQGLVQLLVGLPIRSQRIVVAAECREGTSESTKRQRTIQ